MKVRNTDPLGQPMSSQLITVKKSTPNVGAEIGNIDLTKPLSRSQVQQVEQAIVENGVLFFRDQKLDHASHTRFAGYFGKLHSHSGGEGTASKPVTGHPEIRAQYFDRSSKRVSGEEWHSDQSNVEIPPKFSILYQEIIPPDGGGDTLFLSAAKAYEALSPSMKAYLEGKTATHDGSVAFEKARKEHPVTSHPMVTVHPDSGRKVLFVSRNFTTQIDGVPEDESRAILEFLFNHLSKPYWSMRFRWTDHCVAMWDNRCTQHFAIWDYWPNVRSGFRVFVEGTERPPAA